MQRNLLTRIGHRLDSYSTESEDKHIRERACFSHYHVVGEGGAHKKTNYT